MGKRICIFNALNKDQLELEEILKAEIEDTNVNNIIEFHTLREMKINYCTGCWDCWVKTPGKCVIKDEQEEVLRSFIQADHVIFITPVSLGFIPSYLKKSMDRIIPSIHPYIRMSHGESHHKQRYDHQAYTEVILATDDNTTTEDITFIKKYFDRVALNMDSPIKHFTELSRERGYQNVFINM